LRAASAVPVDALQPRPGAPAGSIEVRFEEDLAAEAAAVARWCADALARGNADGRPRDAAILFRNRRHMSRFAEALGELGVPHHIIGLGGLLETPEIVDLVCTLRVLVDPDAGSDLVRLLAGPRWRIGVRDLAQLERVAAWLHDRDWAHRLLDEDVRARRRASAAADDGRSIVDALDFVVDARDGHTMLDAFSAAGLPRLRDAGERLRRLRMRLGLPLPELVRIVEQELRLDLETIANERLGVGAGNLRAFRDELESFMRIDDRATVASLLSWIDRARDAESLAPAGVDPEPGAVQLLTVHASKGLEWDAVAVPRLVVDEFPGRSRAGSGWVRVGAMPAEFRGDAAELPRFAWAEATTQAEVDQALKGYRTELARRHAEEERRLGYVAITRAKDDLLLSGSFWGGQREFREPSSVLVELADVEIVSALPEAPAGDAPTAESDETLPWPGDPLGSRRSRVQRAAEAVIAAGAASADAPRAASSFAGAAWSDDLELLLAERAAAGATAPQPLPERIPASGFKDWIEDADGVRRRMRRPMPERPFRATRVGTRFHAWVEARAGTAPAADLVDAADDEFDRIDGDDGFDGSGGAVAGDTLDGDADAQLARLQAAFERSEWAGLAPEAIEIELHLPFAGRTVICRIDAVFRRGDRWQVVDWKTGRAPRDAAELRRRELQLALYRLAWADHVGVPPEEVDVAFFFVADERVIVPDRVLDEAELLRRWAAAVGVG
jgi:DNA helicase-2/ATP-dependent DNA helicase PcrA